MQTIFDIEWKLAKNKTISDKKLNKFIIKLKEDLVNIFKNRYKLDLPDTDILISECHRDDKISFHVVINSIINGKYMVYQTNRKREQKSAWDLYTALVKEDENYKM